jgi:hypothetical protein
MKNVTVSTYCKDKYYPRVVRAVEMILMRSDVVAPVEVLIEMGNLSKKNYSAWRAGQVPYLERVFEGNLSKASRILRIVGFHVHDLNMVPIQATYRANTGKHPILRFSKSGEKPLEDAYSRHYKWNQSPEKKLKAIADAVSEAGAPADAGIGAAPLGSIVGPANDVIIEQAGARDK